MPSKTLRKLQMSFACLSVACMAGAGTPAMQTHASIGDMLGFAPSGAAHERSLEQRFDAQLSASEMRAWMKRLASEPNQVGSPHDKANAEWLLTQFRKWGWNAHIEKFDVLYPTPRKELVELVAPTHFKATLHELPVKGDRTSALPGALPPYAIYAADGDIVGALVYVNFGMPDDYKELARMGVSVKGKIVIVRYGGGWRGLKPRLAYQHGAIGCLIYSDPREDGYFRGDTYPKGSWRPPEGVQRGSVANQPQYYPGDPSTPGHAPVPGAKHVPYKDAKPIQKIPVLPISYADATPLLKALAGPVAPSSWRGALPFTYHVGAGPARVHMVVKSHWGLKPIYDVIAKLPGSGDGDQWVIRGNHHDGWVFGAQDPLSGTVALMGEAKAMGTLYQQGWRPRRTIVYASWDGEEPGLLGSTAWAEAHAAELQRKAVLYLNSDVNGRGFLFAGGSHSLQHLVNQVTAGVIDPETKASVRRRQRARLNVRAAKHHGRGKAAQIAGSAGDIPIAALGSGSDYSAFLEHLGIASLNISFGGEGPGGVYHSRYDSFDHFIRFGDPTFEYEVALAAVAGHLVMRTADAKVLPMRFGDFSATLGRYVKDLHGEAKREREDASREQRLLTAGAYQLAADPLHPLKPPTRPSAVPAIDFTSLDTAVNKLRISVQAYEKVYDARAAKGLNFSASRLRQINQLIGTLEQRLLRPQGLPGRPWYRNLIQAPGVFTGYGAKTLPAVREALERQHWNSLDAGIAMTAKVLDGYRLQLDELTALLAAEP